MKKIVTLAIIMAFGTLAASAQRATSSSSSTFFSTEKVDQGVTFGIRGGLNSVNINFSEDDVSYNPDARLAWHVGVIADIPIMESLYFQTGLYLQNKGYKYEDKKYDETETAKPMYLEVPILASYRYNFSDAAQLQINVGPYFAYGIGGKIEWEVENETEDDDFFDDETNKFDVGLSLGAGITVAQHYYLGFAYELGFAKVFDDTEVKSHNRNWMFSVGFNF